MGTTKTRIAGMVLAATAAVTWSATAYAQATASPGAKAGSVSLTNAERKVITEATKHLTTVEAAAAAGYVQVSECTELPGVGGMGVHYIKPSLAGDTVVDPADPELLVFVPTANGSLTLGAVEYFVADADQNLSTDADRPALFGSYPFDGPMLGHEAGMPIHYDLHVWLYDHNSNGQLAQWNPKVSCTQTPAH
ncbi:MAG: hypothetical protein QOF57_612 [Frankiaceae bacterium]|jgi:hypothetical protein|nr:hypothetical protein [Frankiaceae bacterium]MDQ1727858.1 hypothetical protein [Frankiaceae bacterium]